MTDAAAIKYDREEYEEATAFLVKHRQVLLEHARLRTRLTQLVAERRTFILVKNPDESYRVEPSLPLLELMAEVARIT